jgi:hypothetical protein
LVVFGTNQVGGRAFRREIGYALLANRMRTEKIDVSLSTLSPTVCEPLQNCRIAHSESLIKQVVFLSAYAAFAINHDKTKRIQQARGIYPVLPLSNYSVVPTSKVLQSRVLNYSLPTFQRPTLAMAKVLEYPGSSEGLFSLGGARYMVHCSTKVRKVTPSFNITTD